MSTIQNTVWSNIPGESLDPKYEKCRNITEEIYKRINLTFQIKKLEGNGSQSDLSDCSDQIDSNELSNETDLFACDKSSLSSSTDQERAISKCEKYININNNEETKVNKVVPIYKRPRKRFRKRVKKHQSNKNRSDTDGSSDEALPLSRVDVDTRNSESASPETVMGVPNIVILTKDIKSKQKSPKQHHNKLDKSASPSKSAQLCKEAPVHKSGDSSDKPDTVDQVNLEWRNCQLCSLSFRGERGMRRHMAMSHLDNEESKKLDNSEKE